MNTAAYRCVYLGLLAIAVAGCGRSGIHPVQGSVRYRDGSPVTAGKVLLDSGSSDAGSWGSILLDGTFRIGTHSPTDGVPAGEHRVSIVGACIYPPAGSAAGPISLVHERFADAATSGLVFRVPEVTTWEIVVDQPEKVIGRPLPRPAIDPEMTQEAAEERARKEEVFRREKGP